MVKSLAAISASCRRLISFIFDRANLMKGLRHPALRLRDLRRIVAGKLHSVAWDSGTAERVDFGISEWLHSAFWSMEMIENLLCGCTSLFK
jgi:hypothetical protein